MRAREGTNPRPGRLKAAALPLSYRAPEVVRRTLASPALLITLRPGAFACGCSAFLSLVSPLVSLSASSLAGQLAGTHHALQGL